MSSVQNLVVIIKIVDMPPA